MPAAFVLNQMASKLSAREIEAYSDAELDRYLEENKRAVHVHDPKNLSESFIQRLRDRVHNTAPRHTVDLDQVSARLLRACSTERAESEFSADPGCTPASWSGSCTPLSPEEEYRQSLGYEKRYYEKLIRHGGRPMYPIHLIEQVTKHPRDHHELLRCWQGDFPDADLDKWDVWVFGGQWGRWKGFRQWQAERRNMFEGRMPEHTALSKKLLEKHSFTQSFEFDEDRKRQDKLTTWIEYMSYEYRWYDVFARYKRRQKRQDEAWKKLVDSKALKPCETKEYLSSTKCGWQREREEAQGRQDVENARLAVLSARQAMSPQPSASARQALAAAESKLHAATESFESFKRRDDIIKKFNYKTFVNNLDEWRTERHSILLRWIRDQIPLIELEMKQAEAAGRIVDDETGVQRGGDDEAEETRGMKAQKCVDEEEATLQAVDARKQTLKRGRDDVPRDDGAPLKRPRRDDNHTSSQVDTSVDAGAAATHGTETGATAAIDWGTRGRVMQASIRFRCNAQQAGKEPSGT